MTPAEPKAAEGSGEEAPSLGALARNSAPYATIGLFVLGALYTLYFASGLILPVLLALLLAIILHPIVRWFGVLRVPEPLAAVVVVIALFCVTIGGFALVIPAASAWIDRAPQLRSEIEYKLWPVAESIEEAKAASKKIEKIAGGEDGEDRQAVVGGPSLIERALSFTWITMAQGLITLALLYFFLAQGRRSIGRSIDLLPWQRQRAFARNIASEVCDRIASYLQTLCLINICLGALTAAGLFALDLPDPLLWGVFAAGMGFLPYVGPVIVIAALGAASILAFDSLWQMAMPVLFYTVLTIAEGYFITPSVVGRRLTLNPIGVFLSMLLWTWIWGIAGALLSVPILVCATVLASEIARVLGADAAARRSDITEKAATGAG